VRSLWVHHRGMSIQCGKVLGDGTACCMYQQGHSGPCGE
jgi:hypothetical protein